MSNRFTKPIIQSHSITKTYADQVAVDGVNFEVWEGEVFGILGPNGAGKTTTIEILEGLRIPDAGHATVAGINVVKKPHRVKAIIGIQLQSNAFFAGLSLTEIIRLFGKLYKATVNPEHLLSRVELHEKRKSQYKNLSGGQKQRFSMAIALVNDPVVMFLDEPTTGLDPQARRHMWDMVKTLQTECKTIVLTTHYMEEAEELCNRVAIMDHGRVIALDTPQALISDLVNRGFNKPQVQQAANLEDVFLDLTGRSLRED